MNGAEILVSCLKEQGVDTVFGYPGGSVLAVYDALGRDGSVRLVTSCHEQFACQPQTATRVRRPGRCCACDQRPRRDESCHRHRQCVYGFDAVVAITGNVSLEQLGRDSFQEIDIAGVTMPITKHNYIVKSVGELAHTVREAFYYAASGRRGPILIDIPKNIFDESCDYVPGFTPCTVQTCTEPRDCGMRRPCLLRRSVPFSAAAAASSARARRRSSVYSPSGSRRRSD